MVAYGIHRSAISIPQIYTESISFDLSGIEAMIISPWGKGKVKMPIIGQFNLSNALAAFGALNLLHVPFEKALDCLNHLSPVPGRMEMLGGDHKNPLVVVDYAHTPDALEKVLSALKLHCQGKLYCLVGCGGDRDRGKRPLMAEIAERYADKVIVTDDNPRSENPAQIVADMMKGFKDHHKVVVEHDRSKAIREMIRYAQPKDCVLIAGKGAEAFQEVKGEKIPFSDVEKARENLV